MKQATATIAMLRRVVRGAGGPAADLMAVAGAAVAWPMLDAFGRAPEAFVARQAAPWEVVAFGVIVLVGPALGLLAVEGVARLAASGHGGRVHDLLVAVVGGVALARWLRDVASPALPAVVTAGLAGAWVVALLRARMPPARQVLRLMGVTSAWYLVTFLVLSPTGALVRRPSGEAAADRAVDAAVAADLEAARATVQPPPVVVVVFDALPTASLLDGRGKMDSRVAPHLAALAEEATWYRSHTTVSGWTLESLGVLLTGTLPASPARRALGGDDRRNLFTLLGGTYDVYANEPVTRLCPVRLCPLATGAALPGLLDDAASLWWHGEGQAVGAGLPGALDDDRLARTAQWVDRVPVGTDARPDLLFLHALVPHDPFRYLPDGRLYRGSHPVTGVDDDRWVTGPAAAVGRQRHLLQVEAADALLGRLLDRLRATGAYDDALVVVTADHGIAFTPGEPVRGISDAQYEQVLWTPLLVKAPGQTRGRVVEASTRSVDVMPTVADVLGVDVPWELDGAPAREAEAGPLRQPVVQDWEGNHLDDPGAGGLVVVDREQGWQRLADAHALAAPGSDAVWQAAPDLPLVGHRIDGLPAAPSPRQPSGDPPRLAVEGLEDFADVNLDRPLPLELVGELTGQGPRTIAVVLNGTIAAILRADAPGTADVVALLKPDTLVSGANQLTAYQLDDNGRVTGAVSLVQG